MTKPAEIAPLYARFARLVVCDERAVKLDGKWHWRVRCDCGTVKLVKSTYLRSGRTRSCGCLQRERAGGPVRHGLCNSSEYVCWQQMKNRCTNPRSRSWSLYGGRGIRVCAEWLLSFESFLQDMGRKPSAKHSLGRIDNDGNYEAGNCEWQTSKQQAQNRRKPQRAARTQLKKGTPVRRGRRPATPPSTKGLWFWRGRWRR